MIHTQRIRLHRIRDLDSLATYEILLNSPMKRGGIAPHCSGENRLQYR